MGKRTRAYRSWAVDYDYTAKLNAEELVFLEKFTDEYYRDDFRGERLHSDEGKSACYAANNAAKRDLWTAPPHKVTQYRQAIPDHEPNIKAKFLFESDYCLISCSPENFYIEIIDENIKASQISMKNTCVIVRLNSRRMAS